MMRACGIFLTALLLFSSWPASSFLDQWDGDFKKYTSVYLPAVTDWRLLKAQCYQESRLDRFAVSPAGARGLCQFMPGTWSDVSRPLGLNPDDIWLARTSIRAAAYYMGRLHRTWSAERPFMDRHMLAMASYNAGAGHLIKAQKLCNNRALYREIIPCLPQVTGRHSAETIDYVEKIIGQWWPRMMFR